MFARNGVLTMVVAGVVAGGAVPRAATAEVSAMAAIMRGLARDMCELDAGIYSGDFARIQKAAEAIAEHPEPPFGERLVMLTRLGTAVADFRDADRAMQQAAAAVAEAADAREMNAVTEKRQAVAAVCVDCHRKFRRSEAGGNEREQP